MVGSDGSEILSIVNRMIGCLLAKIWRQLVLLYFVDLDLL